MWDPRKKWYNGSSEKFMTLNYFASRIVGLLYFMRGNTGSLTSVSCLKYCYTTAFCTAATHEAKYENVILAGPQADHKTSNTVLH